jgi:lysophospholipase L1-like esterase
MKARQALSGRHQPIRHNKEVMNRITSRTARLLALLPLFVSALEINLAEKGIELKAKAPVGTVRLAYPGIFKEGGKPSGPTEVEVTNHIAYLTYNGGVRMTLEAKDGGRLILKSANVPDGPYKISHHFDAAPAAFGGKVSWSVNESPAKLFPSAKSADAFLFRGDALRLLLTADGCEGLGITLPFGYQELKDQRVWNLQSFQWISYSHLPKEGSVCHYEYGVKAADGSPVTLGTPRVISSRDAYVPYPEPREELWPGSGPIRTFGWQDGIRRNYFNSRERDENAIVFVGDSLTENWKTLKDDFPKYKVANRGVGGDTSRGVLFRFRHDVLCLNPQMVFLCAGANDLTAHGNPDNTLSNVDALIKLARQFNAKMPVVISAVPPSSNPQAPLKPGAREAVNAGLAKLAESYPNVRFFDLSAACLGADGQQDLSLFAKDRLHVAAKGYSVWKAGLEGILADLLKPAAGVRLAPVDLKPFKLVWQDGFDGAALDRAKWDTPHQDRQGASRWRGRNVSLADGILTMKIVKTDDPVYRYESACIRTSTGYDPTNHLFSYTYGYLETRMRLPKHVRSDYWVGFWLLAGDVVAGRTTDTRLGTEIDIFETFNLWNLGKMSHNLHWGGYGKSHNAGGKVSEPHLELLDGQFHTFGLYWDEAKYVYTIDGLAVAETDAVGLGGAKGKDGSPLAKSQGTCRMPAFIKISVEAAPWCGPTSQWESDLPAEDTLLVDYVRVYQKMAN